MRRKKCGSDCRSIEQRVIADLALVAAKQYAYPESKRFNLRILEQNNITPTPTATTKKLGIRQDEDIPEWMEEDAPAAASPSYSILNFTIRVDTCCCLTCNHYSNTGLAPKNQPKKKKPTWNGLFGFFLRFFIVNHVLNLFLLLFILIKYREK